MDEPVLAGVGVVIDFHREYQITFRDSCVNNARILSSISRKEKYFTGKH